MTRHESFDEGFSLQRRRPEGGTSRLEGFGFRNETDVLTDVLLGSPAHLRHLATSSLSRKHLRENPCNIQIAQAQHKDLVAAYESFGVTIHRHAPEPDLPMQVYARDSSVMTPYGAVITAMAHIQGPLHLVTMLAILGGVGGSVMMAGLLMEIGRAHV